MKAKNWKSVLAGIIGGAVPTVMDALVSGETDPKKLAGIFMMSALLSARLYLMKPDPKPVPKDEEPEPPPGPQ